MTPIDQLSDIRAAVVDYLNTKVTVTVSNPTPGTGAGSVINPNDAFKFNVQAVNANGPAGGVQLSNVRYFLKGTSSTLKVPAASMAVARASDDPLAPALTVGTFHTQMFLFPATGDPKTLTVGDTDSINGLEGKAGTSSSGKIEAQIYADVDLDNLFPKQENSPMVSKTFSITPV